jgi:hypothetical protein
VIELAAGKDVAGQRVRRPGFLLALVRRRAERDRVMKVESAGLEQAVNGTEVRGVIGGADTLEHADRGDLVEIALDQRIVEQFNRYLFLEFEARDLVLGVGELLLGERDAERVDPEMPGGVTDERAPAAANVEQTIARLQAKLPADDVKLVLLRSRQIVVPVAEIGAAVDQLRVEKEGPFRTHR